jgi:6-phosphogluconolactonase (cycloisomerase 2 family)
MQPDDRSREGWTRREFVRGAAGLVALPYLASSSPSFAYVASGEGAVHVFLVQGERWTKIQQVSSPAPACVLVSPSQPTLYVANEVEAHEGLPRAAVEAFRIDPLDGRLTLLSRRPLSLSATRPRHMALSPDGKVLAVAAYGGGIYNVFSVAEDGSLIRTPTIFKDAGCGADPQLQGAAHPHSLVFDSSGRRLLASDFGSDRLSVFAVEDGRLQRLTQRKTGNGSGPGATVLHPGGSLLYTWHELEGTLACYRYDAASGTVSELIQKMAFPSSSAGTLAMHPSGRKLYTSEGVWQIDGESGKLRRTRQVLPNATQISAAPDGESIYILDGSTGSIYRLPADPVTGELHFHTRVAWVSAPKSIAIRTRSG